MNGRAQQSADAIHLQEVKYVTLGCNFLVIALVAALFGFTGIAAAAAGIAKFLFFLFLVICLIFLIIGISAGRRIP